MKYKGWNLQEPNHGGYFYYSISIHFSIIIDASNYWQNNMTIVTSNSCFFTHEVKWSNISLLM